MNTHLVSKRILLAGLFAAAVLLCVPSASWSQTLTWDSSGSHPSAPVDGSGLWDTTSSALWSNGTIDAVWLNGDMAVFGGASGTPGTVTIDDPAGISAAGITFNVGGYNISSNGNAASILTLTGTPVIAVNGAASDTISTPMAGSAGFTKLGTGNLTLDNSILNSTTSFVSTLTGTIAVNQGTLTLDFTPGGATPNLQSNIINSGAALSLGGGSLVVNGNIDIAGGNGQTFTGLTLTPGTSTVSVQGTTGTGTGPNGTNLPALTLNAITYNTGAQVVFNGPATIGAGNAVVAATGIINTTSGAIGSSTAQPLVGSGGTANNAAYATVGLYDWATKDSTGTFIVGGSQAASFYTAFASGNPTLSGNADLTGNVGSHNTDTPFTLRFNTNAAVTLTPSGVVSTGGVLVTPNVGAFNSTITAPASDFQPGLRTTGVPGSIVLWQNNTLGYLVLANTGIGDGKGAGGVVDYGGIGTISATGTSGYTGQSFINGGYTMIVADSGMGAPATAAQVNVNGGTLVGNANFSLDNGTVATARNIALGLPGGGLAATGSNIMTVNGTISGAAGTGALTIGIPASSANSNTLGLVPGSGTGTANTTAVMATGGVSLGGNNSYTGGTNVISGALYATNSSGSATGSGNVTIGSGTTLGGGNTAATSGFIGGRANILSTGSLSPGVVGTNNGLGTLTVGGLNMATGSILDLDLSPASNDKVVISSSGFAIGTHELVNLYAAGGLNPYQLNGTFTLFNVTGTAPSVGSLPSDFAVNNPVAGATYSWGENTVGTVTNITLQISGLHGVFHWKTAAGGNWNSGGNWDQSGATPGAGDTASFDSAFTSATGATSISLATPPTGGQSAGAIIFNDSAAQFSLDPGSPAGAITMNNNGSDSKIEVDSGNHSVTANVTLADNVILTASNPTDTLTISGNISTSNSKNVTVTNGAGTVILTGSNSYANTQVDAGNTLQIGNGVSTVASLGAGNVTLNGNLTINRPNAYNLTNNIINTALAPSGTVVQAGAGVTTLSGVNSGFWSTTVNSGTLQVGAGSSLGTGNLTMGGGILDLNGSSPTVNSLSGSGTIDNVSSTTPSVLTINQSGTTTYSGTIQNTAGPSGGTVAVTFAGTGGLTLLGTNTYSGNTTISGGTVTLASSTAIQAGTTIAVQRNTTNGGLLMLSGNINVAANIDFEPGASVGSNVLDVVTGSTPTISGNIVTTGTNSGSQVRLDAGGIGTDTTTSVTFTGNVSINPSTGNFFLERGGFVVAGNGTFTSSPAGLAVGRSAGNVASFTAKDHAVVTVPSITLATGGAATSAVTFTVQDNASVTAAASGVAGNFELDGISTATDVLNVNGGTLNVGGFTQTGGLTTTVNLNGGTIVAGQANSNFIPALDGGAGVLTVQAGGAKFNTNGFDITVTPPFNHDPNLATTDNGLTKSGLGNLTIGAGFVASTYNGPTTVNQGTLTVSMPNGISNQSNLALNGGTFSAGGHSQGLNLLEVNSNSTLDMGPLGTHDNPETVQFANSSGVTWSGFLRINNWQGSLTGGGPDEILVGDSSLTGLTSGPGGQLSDIHFTDYLTGAKFVSGSSGEIVPSSATRLTLGDVNHDGHVDAKDIIAMEQALANLSGFETTNLYDSADVQDLMDINGDGTVDNSDVQALINNLTNGQGSRSTVPEPSSFILIGLALPALWTAARRRRRVRTF